jgi:hypothetical protein
VKGFERLRAGAGDLEIGNLEPGRGAGDLGDRINGCGYKSRAWGYRSRECGDKSRELGDRRRDAGI